MERLLELDEKERKKILGFLSHDLKLEENAAALYARQAHEVEDGWLKKVLLSNKAAEETHIEWLKHAIDRVHYAGAHPRILTGIIDLDDMLFGGIPEGYSIVLTSPPIDELDLFTEKFINIGTDKGKNVLFVSSTPRTKVTHYGEKSQNLIVMIPSERVQPLSSEVTQVFTFPSLSDLSGFNITLEKVLSELNEKGKRLERVLLDILSDILLNHEISTVRKWLGDLLTKFRSRNITNLWILDLAMHPESVGRSIINLFDGHLVIMDKEIDGAHKAALMIKSLYGMKYLDKELTLDKDILAH